MQEEGRGPGAMGSGMARPQEQQAAGSTCRRLEDILINFVTREQRRQVPTGRNMGPNLAALAVCPITTCALLEAPSFWPYVSPTPSGCCGGLFQ